MVKIQLKELEVFAAIREYVLQKYGFKVKIHSINTKTEIERQGIETTYTVEGNYDGN